jgi:hypothetical protein
MNARKVEIYSDKERTVDPFSDSTKIIARLRGTLAAIDAVQAPDLPKPAGSRGQPASKELAHWAVRVYGYSIVSQFREMLRSALILFDTGQFPALFLCARAMFEMGAHAYYVKKHVFQHLGNNDFEATWEFLVNVNGSSRHANEQRKAAVVAKSTEIREGPHISKVIACFNELFQRARKNQSERPATNEYSLLSEFCHPNGFAFVNHIEYEKQETGMVVKFVKPSSDLCMQALPDVLFSCMTLLSSTARLMRRTGDTSLGRAYLEFIQITDPKGFERMFPSVEN